MKKIQFLLAAVCCSFFAHTQTLFVPSGTSRIGTSPTSNVGCDALKLGELFKSLSTIDISSTPPLTFKRFSNFNFSKFQPEGDASSVDDFYEIGFEKDNTIKEIRHRFKDSLRNYGLTVFNFKNYRVLLIKDELTNQTFFHVAVIVMEKNGNNFLTNLKEQFSEGSIQRTTSFYKGSIDKMSAIMFLDENLMPVELLKFIKRQLVQRSYFVYNKDKTSLDVESVGFFFNSQGAQSFLIEEGTCISDCQRHQEKIGQPQQTFFLQPAVTYDIKHPLWLFNGAHDYKICN